MTKQKNKLTPLMQQYFDIKSQYSDTILLFQVGDFYELFFEDAKLAASYLGIALTARGKNNGEPIPLCGVPVHALNHYLHKLVKGGYKVAICEQLEPPKPGSVVKRGVTQVLSPGTLTDANLLDEKSASYLFSFFPMENEWGLLFGELLTAQLFATVIPASSERILESELIRFFPDEVILPYDKVSKQLQGYFKKRGYFTSIVNPEHNDVQTSDVSEWIQAQFSQKERDVLKKHDALQSALFYFYAYLKRNQQDALSQFKSLYIYKADDFLMLDAATQRNLELVKNNSGGYKHTLFSVLDGAKTPMGSRMIKKWIMRPLIKKEAIEQRQDAIETFIADIVISQELESILAQIGDIERIVGRIALSRAQLHDYIALKNVLQKVPLLKSVLASKNTILLLQVIVQHLGNFSSLQLLLENAIVDDPGSDWIIKEQFDDRLDEIRDLVHNSKQKLLALEQAESQKTGIQSLKLRYNQVHGYYFEVTKANYHLVPEYFIRTQTLVGRERFTTSDLNNLQVEIERAKHEVVNLEKELFESIKRNVLSYISQLRKLAHAIAHLDALFGLSKISFDNGYTKPVISDNRDIVITQGRHPVVEQTLENSFIPNDTNLTDTESFWIVTGPNMGGKSTYLRQVALISIMAHVGVFVPAQLAQIPLLDRVFTRIGAGDNLAEGKSTFLVEMEETATICQQATENSLVILDEVGRGTSTFDGLAIAHAVVEYLHSHIGARCLFATHYHELTQLQQQFSGIVSYYAASKKTTQGIVFLHKMIKGVADGSFGVEVAKLAHLPNVVIDRAQELVQDLNLETNNFGGVSDESKENILLNENRQLKKQLAILEKQLAQNQIVDAKISRINYDDLSPKKAFDLLWEMKEAYGDQPK